MLSLFKADLTSDFTSTKRILRILCLILKVVEEK